MRWKQFLTPVQSMNSEEAKEFMTGKNQDEFTLLDVRQPGEYEKNHIPGSKLIPIGELDKRLDEIDPINIRSLSVLKDRSATKKYGEKGKDGVIEIITKQYVEPSKEEVIRSSDENAELIMVEEMPSFPGGERALRSWIYGQVKAMTRVVKEKVNEPVNVIFLVGSDGKVSHVKVKKSVHPLLDEEAIRVVSRMPDWIPGQQNGTPVDVYIQLPIDFMIK